jgi:VWFA-related protein
MAGISRRSLLLSGMSFAAVSRCWGQATFSTGVTVVTVLATVHDRDGRIVKDLSQDDFLLQEDGVPQTIRYFSRESDLPLTIGLLVDTSRSQIGVLEPERRASYTFLDQVLREDTDQTFVVAFDTKVDILQGLTSSRDDLRAALERLTIPGNYATLIFSAIRQASEDVMRKQKGRKAFILLSDGFAFRDPVSIVTAIEFAQRADTLIYSIRFSDHPKVYRLGRAAVQAIASERGKGALERLSRETGGGYFEVSKKDSIESIYMRIEEELRNQYSIGYTPARADTTGKYRKIKLTTKRPGLIVQARDGYYPR